MLDANSCYRALAARDGRFDGRFFTAVVTTGIYCRPVCPARTPGPANVRFYPSAASAEAAGFRPCRRCRPESSPGGPAWQGTSATVSRALGLIAQGVLDSGDVERLAARLGVGSRHLRRLFLEHLGATPIAVAQTRRTHFAKRLIDETRLPMAEVAFAAGFASIRRFNDAIRRTFGRAPRAIRTEARRRAGDVVQRDAALELRLPFRAPLHWESLIDFLALRAIPGVERVDRESYRRTISIEGFQGVIRIGRPPGESCLALAVPAGVARSLLSVVGRVRRLFDLDADPREIAAVLSREPLLARAMSGRSGIRVPGAWDGFELSVRAVLGQQVSVRGATTLAGRLVQLFGDPLPPGTPESGLTHLFPRPEVLAEADLSRVGIPAARREALRALAVAVRDGVIDFDGGLSIEETCARLTALPGIGSWTASYVALRALREPDAFPAGDLGLRRALVENGRLPSARAIEARSQAWRPWRAYAAMALWTADTQQPDRKQRRGSHGNRARHA